MNKNLHILRKAAAPVSAIIAVLASVSCTENRKLASPDGNIGVEISMTETGIPELLLTHRGNPLMLVSAEGLEASEICLSDGYAVRRMYRSSHDDTWTQPWGENKTIRDNHRELAVEMENQEGRFVYILDEENLPRMSYIKTMGELNGNWLVYTGVKAGDKIITSGLQKVVPGSPVRIVENTVTEKTPPKKESLIKKVINKIKNIFK